MGKGQLARVEVDPETEQALSVILDYFNDVENNADAIIFLIPKMTDDQVLIVRAYARAATHAGWRIEAAADASILDRVRSRQGKRDNTEEGKMDAYSEAAKLAGCHEDTIRRNIQIFRKFLGPGVPPLVLEAQQRLKEKAYCDEALRAPDPYKALLEFDKKKQEDFRFNTGDAKRIARAGDPHKERRKVLPAIDKFVIENPANQKLWETWLALTIKLKREIPPLSKILHEAIKGCREQLGRGEESLEDRLLFFLREGPGPTCELLADQLHEDRYKTQGVLDSLVADGTIRAKKQSDDKTKIASARGATPLIYFFNYPAGSEDEATYYGDRMGIVPDDDDDE